MRDWCQYFNQDPTKSVQHYKSTSQYHGSTQSKNESCFKVRESRGKAFAARYVPFEVGCSEEIHQSREGVRPRPVASSREHLGVVDNDSNRCTQTDCWCLWSWA